MKGKRGFKPWKTDDYKPYKPVTLLCLECFNKFDKAWRRRFPNAKEYSYSASVSPYHHCRLCGRTAMCGVFNLKISVIDDVIKGKVGDMDVKQV